MLLVGFFSWWYGAGWAGQLADIASNISHLNDYFSIPNLLKTIFKPFRQISSNESGRSLQDKFEVFLDKLFSRLMGAFVRLLMIITGLVAIIISALFGLARLIIWPLFPLIPVAGFTLMISVGVFWR